MSWQTPRGSMLPAAIDVHLPGADDSAQLRQLPTQVVSQQTPSTQWVESHSVPAEHGWPFLLRPAQALDRTRGRSLQIGVSRRADLAAARAVDATGTGLQFCTPGARHVRRRRPQVPGVLRTRAAGARGRGCTGSRRRTSRSRRSRRRRPSSRQLGAPMLGADRALIGRALMERVPRRPATRAEIAAAAARDVAADLVGAEPRRSRR